MPKLRTHYDNLKVARDAPLEVIRAAYKTLSQKYHPDRNSGNPNASKTMAIINEAYRVLSDPALRKAHDEWIRKNEAHSAPKPQPLHRQPVSRPPPPKAPPPRAAPVLKSKYPFVNHLIRYRWVYLFLIIVECLLLAIMMFL